MPVARSLFGVVLGHSSVAAALDGFAVVPHHKPMIHLSYVRGRLGKNLSSSSSLFPALRSSKVARRIIGKVSKRVGERWIL